MAAESRCEACGHTLEPGQLVCGNCGAVVGASSATPGMPQVKLPDLKMPLPGAGAFGAGVAAREIAPMTDFGKLDPAGLKVDLESGPAGQGRPYKPIQVIAGHECTNVPLNITACDHLEESMFPTQTLATEYIVAPPVQVPNDNELKAQIVRVIATQDDTSVTFDPDQGQDQVLANAGDFLEIPMSTAAYKVEGDKEIIVVQYMVGQSAGFGTSDPAMLLAVPTAQYRNDYLFHAAPTWQANYVDIIAPMGAAVNVDGNAVGGFTAIGNTNFGVAHVQLSNAGDGNHTVDANQAVGISVYGVQSFGSYWYPGGLDLEINPQ